MKSNPNQELKPLLALPWGEFKGISFINIAKRLNNNSTIIALVAKANTVIIKSVTCSIPWSKTKAVLEALFHSIIFWDWKEIYEITDYELTMEIHRAGIGSYAGNQFKLNFDSFLPSNAEINSSLILIEATCTLDFLLFVS